MDSRCSKTKAQSIINWYSMTITPPPNSWAGPSLAGLHLEHKMAHRHKGCGLLAQDRTEESADSKESDVALTHQFCVATWRSSWAWRTPWATRDWGSERRTRKSRPDRSARTARTEGRSRGTWTVGKWKMGEAERWFLTQWNQEVGGGILYPFENKSRPLGWYFSLSLGMLVVN